MRFHRPLPRYDVSGQTATVKTQNALYNKFSDMWQRCRDVIAGQQAMQAAGQRYIPKLKDQDDVEYKAYLGRTGFFNATARTIEGLKGMIFRRPPTVEVPDVAKDLLNDVDLEGTPFTVFLENTTQEVLGVGVMGILVDFPMVPDGQVVTQADAKLQNLRPVMAKYAAESVLNWKRVPRGNKTVLGQVVLKECVAVAVDEFSDKEIDQYRVLDIMTGSYRVRIFRVDSLGKQFQYGADVYPEMNNKRMDFIPFYTIGKYEEPPLLDLVNVNISHYQTTASYEHGCHFTGLPTPVVSGWSPPKKDDGTFDKLYIGSTVAWVFTDPQAKASFLEFTGEGMTCLKDNIADKEGRMAVLGARMLEPQKRGIETAEVAALHRSGENSMLATTAQLISLDVKEALVVFCRWAGADVSEGAEEVKCELNRDFFPVPMTPAELQALVSSWSAQALSDEELFDKLQEREVIAKGKTFEDHQTEIENSGPHMAAKAAASAAPIPPRGGGGAGTGAAGAQEI